MALGAALVDRARVIRQEPSKLKVDGRTQFAETRSEWFRVRLQQSSARKTRAQDQVRSVAEKQWSLLVGTRDVRGGQVALSMHDRFEVVSVELGEAQWEAAGAPEPIRKKRRVIGFVVPVRRVETEPFAPPPPAVVGAGRSLPYAVQS